jgi:hypothetical protein
LWKLQQSEVGDCGLVVGVVGHSCPSISLLRKTICGAMITMGQHVNLSASKSAPQRKCWPEFELFLTTPLLILVSQCGVSEVNECGEACLCVPTLTMSPTAMMFACTVEGNILDFLFRLEFTSWLLFMVHFPFHLIWVLSTSLVIHCPFHLIWVLSTSLVIHCPWIEIVFFCQCKVYQLHWFRWTWSCVWFELMGSIVRMQDSDWQMVVARRGAQESIIAQI